MENNNEQTCSAITETNQTRKTLFSIDSRDLFISTGCLITGIMFSYLAFPGCFRTGWAVTFDFFVIICSIYLIKAKKKLSAYALLCGVFSVVLSANFVITSNIHINFCSFILMIILATVWLVSLSGKHIPDNDIGYIKGILSNTAGTIPFLPTTARSFLDTGKQKNASIKKALIGILCAFPVICIVVPLLMSSDEAFNGLVSKVTGDISDAVIKVISVIIVSPLLINFIVTARHRNDANQIKADHKSIDNVILLVFSSLLSIIYAVYIFSQFAYFFSAFSSMLPEGYNFSYAEYARKGFFEMCTVACINFAIVFVIITFSQKKNKKVPAALKTTSIFICIFTILLISTALSKMVMYINNFGMTQLRICTSVFMIFLFILFVITIAKCFCLKINIIKTALPLAAVFLLLLGIGNIDSVIAKYNYNAFVSGKLPSIDIAYLEELGPAGVPYLIKIYNNNDKKCLDLKEPLKDAIRGKIFDLYSGEFEESNKFWVEKYHINGREYNYFYEMNSPLVTAYSELDYFIEKDPDILTYTWRTDEFDGTAVTEEMTSPDAETTDIAEEIS